MMTKRQVTDYAIENDLWVAKRSELDYLLDEYSQSLAKEVVELIEAQIGINPYTDERVPLSDRQSALLGRVGSLQLASLIIKQHFNIK